MNLYNNFFINLLKMKNIINIIILFFLIIIGSLNMSCKKSEDQIELSKVILAEGMQPIAAPVYIAYEKEFFKRHGLDVKLIPFPTGKLCLDTVIGGKADVGTVSETPIMHVGFQNQSIAILSTMHFATKNTKCISRIDRGIEKPEDLRGKKIGVPIGTNAEYFMNKFIEKYNINRDEIKVVNLNPPEMVGAIVRGDIDASFSWEPYIKRTSNQLLDNSVIFFGDDIYRETYNIVCLKNWVENNPQIVINLINALIEATEFINENRDESIKIVANHIQMEPSELESIWHYYTFKIGLDQLLMDSLIDQAKWAITTGVQDKEMPDYSYMFYLDALMAIDTDAVNIKLQKK